MSHASPASSEITFVHEHDNASFKKKVIKVTLILSVITLIELFLGYSMTTQAGWVHKDSGLGLFFKGAIIILSLAKAFYITAYFMHLADELKNMIMTIVVPLLLFVWFIIAFLADGNSWKNLRNTEAGTKEYKVEQTTPAATPGHEK